MSRMSTYSLQTLIPPTLRPTWRFSPPEPPLTSLSRQDVERGGGAQGPSNRAGNGLTLSDS